MWKFCDLPLHKGRIYTNFKKIFSSFFYLSRYMCGHNFTIKFSTGFRNYTALNRLLNSSPNLSVLHEINWSYTANVTDLQNGKNATSCEKWLLVLQKNFPKNFTKFTKKYLCCLFLILLNAFRPSGLQHC